MHLHQEQMKMNNKYIFKFAIILFTAASLCLLSCNSTSQESKREQITFDYTQEDARKAEIDRIKKLMSVKPAEALWRAKLVNDETIIDITSKALRDFCIASLDQKDYQELYFAYSSLCAAGYEQLANEVISKAELEGLYFKQIPGYGIKKSEVPLKNISQCIAGTVTVWVDLGIKVHGGMGYADRVIGSGFFIDERGYLITNHHVIADVVDPKYEGYGKVYIKLAGDEENRIPAKIIGWDKTHDLALLKTEVKPPYVFSLGSSSDLKSGDRVYAIGSPLGLESTLTSGVVSSTNRKIFTTGSVLQIDASVNSGNSGGPCIDSNGNVQAVVFAGIPRYQGLNFAIPVEYLKQELPILYYGGLRNAAWLGGYGKTYKVSNRQAGLEVQYFVPSSAFARAGIKPGDIITSIDGKVVNSLEDIQNILRTYVPETIVQCSYLDSEKQKRNCLLYLTERPASPGYYFYQNDTIQNSFLALYGISLVPSSTSNSRTYLITKVLNGSVADEAGFSENDPVTIGKIQFNDDKSQMYTEFAVKRRKKGYLDVSIGLPSNLDGPNYF